LLTEEEKQKIAEEEKYKLKVKQDEESKEPEVVVFTLTDVSLIKRFHALSSIAQIAVMDMIMNF
jgi:hypothetical protein